MAEHKRRQSRQLKRCPAVVSNAAEKWFVGFGVFFYMPHLHIVHPFVPLQTHPNIHYLHNASQEGSALLRKRTEP